MTDTRDRVLKTLLNKQRCTINEIADEVGINPISIRHHITRLEAEGMVDSREELHGVGRPRRIYFLTEAWFRALSHALYAINPAPPGPNEGGYAAAGGRPNVCTDRADHGT